MSLNLSTDSLRSILSLSEKRDALLAEIQKVETEISNALGGGVAAKAATLGHETGHGRTAAGSSPKVPGTKRAVPGKRGKGGGKRGKTKELILGALNEAGAKGISVKELSVKLGLKNQNVHVWFATTGKKLADIEKAGKGIFRLKPADAKIATPVAEQPQKTKASVKEKRKSSTSKSKLTGKK